MRIGEGKDSRIGIVTEVDEHARIAKVALNYRDIHAGGDVAVRSFRFEDLTPLA